MVLVPLFDTGPQLSGFALLAPESNGAIGDARRSAERNPGTTLEALVVLLRNRVLLRQSEVAPLGATGRDNKIHDGPFPAQHVRPRATANLSHNSLTHRDDASNRHGTVETAAGERGG
jgi:hypothetical protein